MVYKARDGTELDRAKHDAGYRGKARGGNPKSVYIRERDVREEVVKQCAERGMNKCPTEFGRIANVRFHAFGGHTPEMLAKELALLKRQTEQPDIALLLCMFNGLAKYSRAIQHEPAGYREKFCDYCAAAKNSGQRVILIIGGDGAKWQIGNPEI